MSKLFTPDNALLTEKWSELELQGPARVSDLEKWSEAVLLKGDILTDLSSVSLLAMIREFYAEIHEIQEINEDMEVEYSDAVGFINWCIASFPNEEPKQQEQNIEDQMHHYLRQEEEEVLKEAEYKETLNNMQEKEQEEENHTQSPLERNNTKEEKEQLQESEEIIKERLKIIFEHYCRLSYATGTDPTFEQIKHKTSIMTINKFMIFSRDFQLTQFNRSHLIETFKKNSECYKEMSYEMFINALNKLREFISLSFFALAKTLKISSSNEFKETIKRLNITVIKSVNKKVVPLGYKFKYEREENVNNEYGKKKAETREYENKPISTVSRTSMPKSLMPINHTNSYNKINIDNQLNSYNKLNPIPHKFTLPPPRPPKREPLELKREEKSQKSDKSYAALGYAELHKMKHSETSLKRSSNHSNNNEKYKLNHVLQEAKLMVNTNRPFTEESDRHPKVFDTHTVEKMEQIGEKAAMERERREQLANILDINPAEEDEYLKQHLEIERKAYE